MVNEADPLVNKFISVPREMGSLNCAAFVAGVIKGVLDGAGFVSLRVALSRCLLALRCDLLLCIAAGCC